MSLGLFDRKKGAAAARSGLATITSAAYIAELERQNCVALTLASDTGERLSQRALEAAFAGSPMGVRSPHVVLSPDENAIYFDSGAGVVACHCSTQGGVFETGGLYSNVQLAKHVDPQSSEDVYTVDVTVECKTGALVVNDEDGVTTTHAFDTTGAHVRRPIDTAALPPDLRDDLTEATAPIAAYHLAMAITGDTNAGDAWAAYIHSIQVGKRVDSLRDIRPRRVPTTQTIGPTFKPDDFNLAAPKATWDLEKDSYTLTQTFFLDDGRTTASWSLEYEAGRDRHAASLQVGANARECAFVHVAVDTSNAPPVTASFSLHACPSQGETVLVTFRSDATTSVALVRRLTASASADTALVPVSVHDGASVAPAGGTGTAFRDAFAGWLESVRTNKVPDRVVARARDGGEVLIEPGAAKVGAASGCIAVAVADQTQSVHIDTRRGLVVRDPALALGAMCIVGTRKSGRKAADVPGVVYVTFDAPRATLAELGVRSQHFAFELRATTLVAWYHDGDKATEIEMTRVVDAADDTRFTAYNDGRHSNACCSGGHPTHTLGFQCALDTTKQTLKSVTLVVTETDFGEGRIVARACQPTPHDISGKCRHTVHLADGSGDLVIERPELGVTKPNTAKLRSLQNDTGAEMRVFVGEHRHVIYTVDANELASAMLQDRHSGVHLPTDGGRVTFRIANPDAHAPTVATRAEFHYAGTFLDDEPGGVAVPTGKVAIIGGVDTQTRLYVPRLDAPAFKDLLAVETGKSSHASVLLATPDGTRTARLEQTLDSTTGAKKASYRLVVDVECNERTLNMRAATAANYELATVAADLVLLLCSDGTASLGESQQAPAARKRITRPSDATASATLTRRRT